MNPMVFRYVRILNKINSIANKNLLEWLVRILPE